MSQPGGAKNSANKTLATSDFTSHADVVACLAQLNTTFNPQINPLTVSDVLDSNGNQYVNLVQKGGGVLGVALVGYTYILEQMGIRFLRLAGTSAGAINTALMTVIGKKEDAKSVSILKSICDLNFFNLVDGHPAARWIIKKFITHSDFTVKVKNWLLSIFMIAVLLITCDFVFFGLQHKFHSLNVVTVFFFVLTAFYLLILGLVLFYISRLSKRLKDSGYGINPGNYFYDWIKEQLVANGVNTVTDLNAKASTLPQLHLRTDNAEGVESLKGDVTFIASELVTQNKIQFPEMCFLFRQKSEIDSLQPAGFVRASMSIPVFFESYMIDNIPCTSDEIKQAWIDVMNEPDPPSNARFVDGGMLSNFPINIFYNSKVLVPRLPSFGIDLDDSKPDETAKNATGWSLVGYFGRMFNTIRDYYDKDFLLKNKVYEKGIGKIPLSDYNWLNFFLSDQDKIDMFVLGAKTATKFLIDFDWNSYKDNRTMMQMALNKDTEPKANIK
jgi:NTE family protein